MSLSRLAPMEAPGASPTVADLIRNLPFDPKATRQHKLKSPAPKLLVAHAPHKNATNFQDRLAFRGYEHWYANESKTMAQLETLQQRGTHILADLYTYRSTARAMPKADNNDSNKRNALYMASFQVRDKPRKATSSIHLTRCNDQNPSIRPHRRLKN